MGLVNGNLEVNPQEKMPHRFAYEGDISEHSFPPEIAFRDHPQNQLNFVKNYSLILGIVKIVQK
jgi:hypothetical protein